MKTIKPCALLAKIEPLFLYGIIHATSGGNHRFSTRGLRQRKSTKFAQQFDSVPAAWRIMKWISLGNSGVKCVCWNKMSLINVTLVPLMWPCRAERSVRHKHDLSKAVSALPCSFFNPLIFLAWRIYLFVTWNGISSLWTMKPGSLNTVLHLADAPPGDTTCVRWCACKWRVQTPRSMGAFMWTARTLFI